MKSIATIFWNASDRRPRAGWRLLLQFLICLLVIVAALLSISAIAIGQIVDTPPEFAKWEIIIESLATLPAIWLGARLLDRRRFADLGLHLSKDWAVDFGFGLGLGALLVSGIFLVQLAAGWVTVTGTFVTRDASADFALTIAFSIGTFLLISVQEELLCRGYMLTNLAEGLNFRRLGPHGAIVMATLVSAGLFAVLHLLNQNTSAVSTLGVFSGGIVLALGYILTGELAIPIGFHTTWNLFQANVFGFPVSGEDMSSASFLATERHGPELWAGDAFGPESGLLAFAAVSLGCLLIVLWVRLRYGRVALRTDIAASPRLMNKVTKP